MTSDSLEKSWEEMERLVDAGSTMDGLLKEPVPGEWTGDYFVGVTVPSKSRFFCFDVARDHLPTSSELPVTQGYTVNPVKFPGGSTTFLLLQLNDVAFSDVFSSLVADLVVKVDNADDDKVRVSTFINRLQKWQHFLKGFKLDGMTPESQRGLFGELHFLETVLYPSIGEEAVGAWTGPEHAHQDFQFSGCGVEVKTSIQKKPQFISIANEKELDPVPYRHLFLWHVALDQNRTSGVTLNQKVARMLETVAQAPSVYGVLQDKLRLYGYHDAQAHLYDRVFYVVRTAEMYAVKGNFPRIVEADLRGGVGQVRYAISIDACNDYLVDMKGFNNMIEEGCKNE